jgi:predicted RNA-binding Zn-ribbon protein involved in translation (DUF1610 family)
VCPAYCCGSPRRSARTPRRARYRRWLPRQRMPRVLFHLTTLRHLEWVISARCLSCGSTLKSVEHLLGRGICPSTPVLQIVRGRDCRSQHRPTRGRNQRRRALVLRRVTHATRQPVRRILRARRELLTPRRWGFRLPADDASRACDGRRQLVSGSIARRLSPPGAGDRAESDREARRLHARPGN